MTRILLILLLIASDGMAATLTVNNIPKVSQGGTTPQLANSNVSTDANGNVGINSTLPGSKLDITGDVRIFNGNVGIGTFQAITGTQLSVLNGITDEGGGIFEYGGGFTSLPNAFNSGYSTSGEVSGTQSFYSNGNSGSYGTFSAGAGTLNYFQGNVGIGTQNPGKALDVQGTIRGSYFSGNGSLLTNIPGTWTVEGGGSRIWYTSGNVGIGGINPTHTIEVTGTGYFSSNISTLGNITIAASGQVQFNGNASNMADNGSTFILNAPADNIQLNSQGILLTPNSGVVRNQGSATVDNGLSIGTTTSVSSGLIVAAGNVGIGTSLPSTLMEVGTRKFNVLSGGNVGIGSINPGQALDVQGTVKISNATPIIFTNCKASSGTRYVCVDTSGNISCSASACSGT